MTSHRGRDLSQRVSKRGICQLRRLDSLTRLEQLIGAASQGARCTKNGRGPRIMLELKINNNRWNLSKRTVEGLEVMNPQPMHNPLKVPSCQRDDNDSEHSVLLAVTPVYCPSPFHGLQAPLLEGTVNLFTTRWCCPFLYPSPGGTAVINDSP